MAAPGPCCTLARRHALLTAARSRTAGPAARHPGRQEEGVPPDSGVATEGGEAAGGEASTPTSSTNVIPAFIAGIQGGTGTKAVVLTARWAPGTSPGVTLEGRQRRASSKLAWMPASAGMTVVMRRWLATHSTSSPRRRGSTPVRMELGTSASHAAHQRHPGARPRQRPPHQRHPGACPRGPACREHDGLGTSSTLDPGNECRADVGG